MSNKNDLNPLMFIDTINTQITKTTSQQIYDSRYHQSKKKIIIIDDKTYQKIKNIISLYNNNHPITCQITISNYQDKESIIGIPFSLKDNNLQVKQDDLIINIDINNIEEIIILAI